MISVFAQKEFSSKLKIYIKMEDKNITEQNCGMTCIYRRSKNMKLSYSAENIFLQMY